QVAFGSAIDFPQIAGTGITVRTLVQGSFHPIFGREIVIGTNRGRNDLMHAEGILPGFSFQPLITQPILNMVLGMRWGASDARLARTVYSRAAARSDVKVPIMAPGEEPVHEAEEFSANGPGLALFDSDGLLASDETDFGVA